jgi:N6-adenosine-specific RNA methylase IME4
MDPPWEYRDTCNSGKRGVAHKYILQSNSWLSSLDIKSLATDNCALFIWATCPKLPEILDIIKHWGFTYKTVAFTWIKRSKKNTSYHFGMGNWTRANTELCLLATLGKPKRIVANISQLIISPVEEHSKKPAIVRTKIVELLGDLPRIELFATTKSDGWDSTGFVVDGINVVDFLKGNF